MDVTTIIEIAGIVLGGGGLIGFVVGFATFKWMKLKVKSEAKGSEAEADMKRQDYYQEMMEDLQKDRERMKEVREEQEAYIHELKQDRKQLREERDTLRQEKEDLTGVINKLQEEQRKQGDKIARLGRMYKAMTPLICTNTNCKKRQGDIMGLVDDDSFDVVEEAKKNTKNE